MADNVFATVIENQFDSILKVGELELKKFTKMGVAEAQLLADKINEAYAKFEASVDPVKSPAAPVEVPPAPPAPPAA